MNLRIVSSSDDRALAIRDHVLPLVRGRGALETQRGPVRLVSLRTGPWAFEHWTPFADLARARRPRRAIGTRWSGSTRVRTCPMGSTCGATERRC